MSGQARVIQRGGRAGEGGSVLVLGAAVVAVCLTAIVVLADATSAFLQRQHLLGLADSAALAGAQAIDLAAYYEHGASAITALETSRVPGVVRSHLRAARAADVVPGLRIASVKSDGRTVDVTLAAPLRLPFLQDLASGTLVRVQSSARLAYRVGP